MDWMDGESDGWKNPTDLCMHPLTRFPDRDEKSLVNRLNRHIFFKKCFLSLSRINSENFSFKKIFLDGDTFSSCVYLVIYIIAVTWRWKCFLFSHYAFPISHCRLFPARKHPGCREHLPLRFDIGGIRAFGSAHANREKSNILEMIANRRGTMRGVTFSRRLPLARHFANCKKSAAVASIHDCRSPPSRGFFAPNESAAEFRANSKLYRDYERGE